MTALTAHMPHITLPKVRSNQPHLQAQRPLDHVHANITYTHPPKNGEELYQYAYHLPDGSQPANLEFDDKVVPINNIYAAKRQFSLHRNGFQLERLTVEDNIDWSNADEVHARYYPAVEELIKSVSGASRVHVFDHTLRKGTTKNKGLGDASNRVPVSRAHVDYNTISGVNRLHQVLPDEAAELSKTPFAVIQVWRPLKGPVDESPLGMVDAETVSKDDLMDLRLQFESRTGYNYTIKYNPAHRWYYAKGMTTDEAYVFKCYDSRNDRARFTPHTGFSDPTTRPDAAPRESIEIRAYAFWENEPPQPIATEL